MSEKSYQELADWHGEKISEILDKLPFQVVGVILKNQAERLNLRVLQYQEEENAKLAAAQEAPKNQANGPRLWSPGNQAPQ